MKFFNAWVARCVRDTRGQDLIEYALLAGFIAVVVAAFFPTQIAPSIETIFAQVQTQLSQAAGS